ncbi:MAG: diguanylate cyclase [Proteobacteria bacterium]|nr:MAG: diguanylate cyclase [Pseudomonadota bacterium]
MKTGLKRATKILIAESASKGEGPIALFFTTVSFHDNPDFPLAIESVHLADSTPEVLKAFDSEHPDVVIINVDDFGEEAFRLCASIRKLEKDRHSGIIFYSEGTIGPSKIDLDQVLASGADDLIDTRVGDHELLARIHSVYRFKLMTDRLRTANHRLKQLSLTDELTGLSNMRSFNIEYQKLIKNCRDGQNGLGLIMFDLDRFKSINDTANHLVGSFVISEIGHLMRFSGVLGDDALAARYGGDEYIIAVPSSDVKEVWKIADKVHDLILRSVFKKEQFSFKLTASFGVAWAKPGFEGKSDDLIRGADVMLYRCTRFSRPKNGKAVHVEVSIPGTGQSAALLRDYYYDEAENMVTLVPRNPAYPLTCHRDEDVDLRGVLETIIVNDDGEPSPGAVEARHGATRDGRPLYLGIDESVVHVFGVNAQTETKGAAR